MNAAQCQSHRHGAAGAWSRQVEGENWRAGGRAERVAVRGRKWESRVMTKASVNLETPLTPSMDGSSLTDHRFMFFGGFFCRESSGPQAERLQSSVGGNSNQTTPDRHKNDSKNKSKYKWEQKWKVKSKDREPRWQFFYWKCARTLLRRCRLSLWPKIYGSLIISRDW